MWSAPDNENMSLSTLFFGGDISKVTNDVVASFTDEGELAEYERKLMEQTEYIACVARAPALPRVGIGA